MSNHIHLTCLPAGRYRKIEDGYEREAIQRGFLKFISQIIKKRFKKKNHPKVLEQFYVGAKR